eukprot:14733763-Alexandrium_andersonii.AAC.1
MVHSLPDVPPRAGRLFLIALKQAWLPPRAWPSRSLLTRPLARRTGGAEGAGTGTKDGTRGQ